MTTTTRPSWREEMRQDRLAAAQIDRDRETARVQARIAERETAARIRRADQVAWQQARHQARAARTARRASRAAWVRAHTLDLLFVPVIVVPAVLAWTAMAAYGGQLYGAAGLMLPAFSEGAMWAFALATAWTVRQNERARVQLSQQQPVWHLRAGTWAFAGVAAALNFLHGLTVSVITGVVYAVISVAGVVVHQFITAGPRRPRAERDQARIERLIRRRERKIRQAAARAADAELDETGQVRLLYRPGLVTVKRRGRAHLVTPVRARTEPDPDLARTGGGGPGPGAGGGGPGPDPDEAAGVDRAGFVAELAEQIRAAMTDGSKWTPDYEALMARSGYGRSWCEKAVRDARTDAFRTAVTAPGSRTGPGPDGTARTPLAAGVVAGVIA